MGFIRGMLSGKLNNGDEICHLHTDLSQRGVQCDGVCVRACGGPGECVDMVQSALKCVCVADERAGGAWCVYGGRCDGFMIRRTSVTWCGWQGVKSSLRLSVNKEQRRTDSRKIIKKHNALFKGALLFDIHTAIIFWRERSGETCQKNKNPRNNYSKGVILVILQTITVRELKESYQRENK